MSFPSRRDFLQTVIVAGVSCALPGVLLARRSWFLHSPTGGSWPVPDPVRWSLENARQPILERASKGLLKLTPADGNRIIRLVVRRSKLNLIEIQPGRVVVHHWGKQGKGDLRPFFKTHELTRKGIEVVLKDRKREHTTIQHGDDFLYGERLGEKYPVGVYQEKWRRQSIEEANDWTPAPCSYSNYCWPGVEKGCIPWKVLKASWRHENERICPNCDKATLLISFGNFTCGFYKRGPRFTRICSLCMSMFVDHSHWDAPKWMLANLGEPLLPSAEIIYGHLNPWGAHGHPTS